MNLANLAALANGIIPPDERDAGAACVDAARRLAEKARAGVNTDLYLKGLETAQGMAREKFGRDVSQLGASEIHQLLADIRQRLPGFFRQLRLDVSALYLADPEVWKWIGFPGPSIATGGHPDF